MNRKNQLDMTQGPILGNLLKFSIPVICSNFLQLVFNAADVAVVGQFAGDASLAVSKVDVLIRMERRKEAREVLDALVAKGTPRGVLKEWYDRCK